MKEYQRWDGNCCFIWQAAWLTNIRRCLTHSTDYWKVSRMITINDICSHKARCSDLKITIKDLFFSRRVLLGKLSPHSPRYELWSIHTDALLTTITSNCFSHLLPTSFNLIKLWTGEKFPKVNAWESSMWAQNDLSRARNCIFNLAQTNLQTTDENGEEYLPNSCVYCIVFFIGLANYAGRK